MEKYIFKDFPDKTTPFSANVFNEIQDNIETEINNSGVVVSATEPQGESRKKVWIQKGKNLFNKDNVLTGYRLDYSGGNFADTNYFISEYIPVVANQKYSVNYVVSALNRVCWYDSNKTMINYTNTYSTVEMPSNAKYIRLCGEKSALDTVQLEQNDTSSPYEAYVEPKIYILNNNGVYEEFIKKQEQLNKYSEIGEKIGTWINGKPLYRKIIKTTAPKVETDGTFVERVGTTIANNIDMCFIENAFITDANGGSYPLPYTSNSGRTGKAYISADKKMYMITNHITFSERPVILSVLYTQTTDTATTLEEVVE